MNNQLENVLKSKWNSLDHIEGASLLIDVEHPLEWYVQFNEPYHKSLVVLSDTKITSLKSSSDIQVICSIRSDGRYAIRFKLENNNQTDVFITMAADLISFSKVAKNAREGMNRLLCRYASWLKLLSKKHKGKLSINQQKGLIGELLFLRENLIEKYTLANAINGWVGPEAYDQDFVYYDTWFEIKSTSIDSNCITISSLEQLYRKEKGQLIIYRIDKCPTTEKNATTLYEIVESIYKIIRDKDPLTEFSFTDKLNKSGYLHSEEYRKNTFLVSEHQAYWVTNDFPKLTRKEVSNSIINLEYILDIRTLEKWKN